MLIAVDTSAVIAIMLGEPSAPVLLERLSGEPERVMSAASYLEAGTVLAGRRRVRRLQAIQDLDAFLDRAGIALVAVDEPQARLALRARILYGRGMGSGGVLNFGDVFAYALAKSRDCPLLFVGDDFTGTDVTPAF